MISVESPPSILPEDLLRVQLAEERVLRLAAELEAARLRLVDAQRIQNEVGSEIRAKYQIGPLDKVNVDGAISRTPALAPLASVPPEATA